MKRVQRIFIFLITIVVAIISVYALYLKKQNTGLWIKYNTSQQEKIILESQLNEENNFRDIICSDQYKSLKKLMIYSDDDSKISFQSIIFSKKVVLLYSELTCLECINDKIRTLIEFEKSTSTSNVIILASYFNKRDLVLFKKINGVIDVPIYRFDKNATGLLADSLNLPILFTVDSSLIVNNLIPIDKDNTNCAKQYLQRLERELN